MVFLEGVTIHIDDSGGVGDHISWVIEVVDCCGNVTTQDCEIEVINPGKGKGKTPP